jgi:dephospho-CoA kinase
VSKWTGKYVIGLTGNIGTGKSVVRKMLEHLGAYGIDADALGHRVIAKGAPGYQPVLDTFGRWILDTDEQIDRSKLGRIVFTDPDALSRLEHIVHPVVEQSVDILVRRTAHTVIVIEAIKLLEANLNRYCDSIWVTFAPPEIQLSRLIHNRKMNEAEARQRITAQPPQERKISAANVIIKNVGSYEDTWKQVAAAWKAQVTTSPPSAESLKTEQQVAMGEMSVHRAGPRHSHEIAQFLNHVQKIKQYHAQDIMASFGEKGFLLLRAGPSIVGVIGWQVENLISRTSDIFLDPIVSINQALALLIMEMEKASRDLQCEASLVFVPNTLSQNESWSSLGYERKQPQSLGVLAWQESAIEISSPETTLFFKQLRQDRILRPI